jgi:putative transcriptional regulator
MNIIQKQQAEFSLRLKQHRKQMGFSQEELAKNAGIDRKTVNRIENGHFSPSLETLFRLCFVLEVEPSVILGNGK